jgi:translocator protein
MNRWVVWGGLAGWLFVTFLAAGVGSLFAPGEWYAGLAKPRWTPPGWVFGPVWTVLYVLMALSAWLVWRRDGFSRASGPLGIYLVQLVFNAAWTWLFFGLKRPDLAFAEIIALWLLIVATIVAFLRRQRLAAVLLVPYFLWVTFASFLNFEIWRLN